MKKLLAILMAMAMLFAFAGCGSDDDDKKEDKKPSSSQNEDTDKDSSDESELPSKPEKPSSTPSTNKNGGAADPEKLAKKYMEAIIDGDLDELLDLTVPLSDEDEEQIDDLEEMLETVSAIYEYVDDYSIEAEQTEYTDDEDDIAEVVAAIELDYIDNITALAEVEIELTASVDGEENSNTMLLLAAEIDGRWFVASTQQ